MFEPRYLNDATTARANGSWSRYVQAHDLCFLDADCKAKLKCKHLRTCQVGAVGRCVSDCLVIYFPY